MVLVMLPAVVTLLLRCYGYDVMGRMSEVTVTEGGVTTTANYAYDTSGIRVQRTQNGATTVYHIDPSNPTGYAQVLEEGTDAIPAGQTEGDGKLDAGEVGRAFTLGMQILAQATDTGAAIEVLTLLSDARGSTRAVLNAAAVTASFAYDAGGSPLGFALASAPTPILYAAQYLDALSGLSYNRARWYDPSTRTFTRVDDYRPGAGDWLNSNLLLYAGGDPVNASDPSGNIALVSTLATIGLGAMIWSAGASSAGRGWSAGQGFETYLLLNGYHAMSPLVAREWQDPVSRGLLKALMEVEGFLNPPGGPGFWEGMAPVWGSASTSGAHFENGRPVAGSFFAIVAALEVSGIPALARLLVSRAAIHLAKEGAGVGIDAVLGMARRNDCVACAIAYDSARTGRLVPAALPSRGRSSHILEYAGKAKAIRAANSRELVSQLSNYGDGAGGIVWGRRADTPGHAFNWEVRGGRVHLWDPQNGGPPKLDDNFTYFEFVSTDRSI